MDLISTPAACKARMADSRPEPGPLTRMSRERRPESLATVAAAEAACCAAKGVPLRDPLKPSVPALDQVTTCPSMSVMVTCVLLKEAWMWATPWTTWRFSFLGFLELDFLVGTAGAAADTGSAIRFLPLRLGGGGGLGADQRPARALARARIGMGALAAHGEVAAVAHPAVGADLHQPLDVHRHFLAEVAFDLALLVDDLRDAAGFFLGEVLDAHARVDPGLAEDLVRAAHADPVDVGQRDLHALRARQVDACDTCHLSLPLLVLLIRADDADHALAAHHLAFHADFPDRTPDLHPLRLLWGFPPHLQAGGTTDFTRKPFQVIPSTAPAHDPAPSEVVGHQLHHDRLPGKEPQQARGPRDVGRDLLALLRLQLHAEERVREALDHASVHFQGLGAWLLAALRHAPPLPFPLPARRDTARTGSRGRGG